MRVSAGQFRGDLYVQAKASNETQQRANDSKSDGMSRPGADALGDVISKVRNRYLHSVSRA
jgi:hypothetical protein